MANKLYEETHIQDIADAIREKGGTGTYTVQQMGGAIRAIQTGGGVPLTSFTNVLNIDTTIIKDGYRMAPSGYIASDNTRAISIHMPKAGTYKVRVRGIVPYNANIYKAAGVTLDGHGGASVVANYYDGYVDEYGDYTLDVKMPYDNQYLVFNMFAIDNAIITINEPIGTGNYTNA